MGVGQAVRRRHRGWRVGRVRAGQPALRRQRHQRPGARGRPRRLEDRPVHPHARGAAVPHRQPLLRLALPDRSRAAPQRPAGRARPRPGARRLVEHQRDDLPARQPDGLRALGGRAGPEGVGLRPLPAVLQADGDPPPRGRQRGRRRLARRRRPARARARTGREPALHGVLRGGPGGRPPAHRRRQRLPAGGVRALRPQPAPRPPALRRSRIPAPRPAPQEPRGRDPRDGHPGAVRRQARRRCRLPARRAAAPHRRCRRGHPVRRRDQHPAAAPALRRRRRVAAPRPRHRRRAPLARCRREPAGPPRGLRAALLQAAGLDPAGAAVASQAGDRLPVAGPPARPRRHQPLRGRGLRPEQRGRRLPQPDVPLPSGRDPLRRLGPGGGSRLPGARRADVRRHPRLGADPVDGPEGASVDAVQLPLDADRPPGVGGGDPGHARHPQPAGVRAVRRRRDLTGPPGRDRRGDPRVGARRRRDRAAPLVHRGHGCRRAVRRGPRDDAGARARGPPGRRRLGVPLRAQRQHLRARDDGGREGRRPDRGQHAARAPPRCLGIDTARAPLYPARTEESA